MLRKKCFVALEGDVPVAVGSSPLAAAKTAAAALAGLYDPSEGVVQHEIEVVEASREACEEARRLLALLFAPARPELVH